MTKTKELWFSSMLIIILLILSVLVLRIRGMEGDIVFDKIKAYTSEFSIDKDAPLEIVPCSIGNNSREESNSTVLWWNGFNPVYGQKAYLNRNGVNITIENGRLSFFFNPSSIMFGNNFKIINFDEFKESLTRVGIILQAQGIHIDLETCKLSRVDLCCNIEVDHDVNLYRSALQLISPKFMPKKRVLVDDGSYTVLNKSRQYIFYDKLKQMKSNGIDIEAIDIRTHHIMRVEVRLMNHKSSKNSLNVETLGELLDRNIFTHIKNIFKDIMKNDFFRFGDLKNIGSVISTDSEVIRQIRATYPNKAIDIFYLYKYLENESPFSLEDLTSLMTACGYSPSTISERKKQFLFALTLGQKDGEKSLRASDLLAEILSKIIST